MCVSLGRVAAHCCKCLGCSPGYQRQRLSSAPDAEVLYNLFQLPLRVVCAQKEKCAQPGASCQALVPRHKHAPVCSGLCNAGRDVSALRLWADVL